MDTFQTQQQKIHTCLHIYISHSFTRRKKIICVNSEFDKTIEPKLISVTNIINCIVLKHFKHASFFHLFFYPAIKSTKKFEINVGCEAPWKCLFFLFPFQLYSYKSYLITLTIISITHMTVNIVNVCNLKS